MCSSNSAGKINKAYYSTCGAVADFVLDTPFFTEVLPVECSVVRHVTGNDQDYLRKIPRVVVQKSALL